MRVFSRFIVILVLFSITGLAEAKGGSSVGGGSFSSGGRSSFSSSNFSNSGRSSFSSGVKSYTPPSRPFNTPITRITPVTPMKPITPRIVPRSAPVINRTTVINNNYHTGGSYGYQDHFWSNWFMFSMLTNHNNQPVIVQSNGQSAQGIPYQQESQHTGLHIFLWLIFFSTIIAGLWFWLVRRNK